jgi:hypothetical protein
VVKYGGKTVFDKNGGDGKLTEDKSLAFVQKLKAAITQK